MTTIAYDGKTIASDSMAVSEWKEPLSHQKIFTNVGDYQAVGFCGDYACVEPFLFWLANRQEHEYDQLLMDRDFSMICINKDGMAEMFATGMKHSFKINHYYAIGSGSQFAMSAMMCGKTAAEAVAISRKLDLYTGGNIVSVALDNPQTFDQCHYEIV